MAIAVSDSFSALLRRTVPYRPFVPFLPVARFLPLFEVLKGEGLLRNKDSY